MNGRALFGDIGRTLVVYVRGQFLIAAILTVIYIAGFAICKVPAWGLIGVLAGALHLIPRIGALFALLIPMLLTFLGGGGVERILGVLAVFVIAQALEGFYLTPRLLGARLHLRPAVVFLAILIGGALFGVVGLLAAVPAIAVAKVFMDH